jgi:sulfur dioxygenase
MAPPVPPGVLLAAAAGGQALLLRQLFDADTGTFSYLLADVPSGQGLLIDPVFEQHERDLSLIQELGLELVACLDTHAHADHVTGSWLMHAATHCGIGLATAVGAENVTIPLQHGDTVVFGERALHVRSTPGHTNGCLTYVLDDASMAFTGDALLVRGCGRCDFQQGNAHTLWTSITEQIFSLPNHCLLYPGHDYTGRGITSVAEEKTFNARMGGEADERDFVGHMENMKLSHPGRIAIALPGNMRSGKPKTPASEGHWAPTQRSFAGLPELAPAWLAEHMDEVAILDVRSQEEVEGPDGCIEGARNIPLPELTQRLGELSPEQALVVVCHSGSRSALATQQLLKEGHAHVANLRGGLVRWKAEGYPVSSQPVG